MENTIFKIKKYFEESACEIENNGDKFLFDFHIKEIFGVDKYEIKEAITQNEHVLLSPVCVYQTPLIYDQIAKKNLNIELFYGFTLDSIFLLSIYLNSPKAQRFQREFLKEMTWYDSESLKSLVKSVWEQSRET